MARARGSQWKLETSLPTKDKMGGKQTECGETLIRMVPLFFFLYQAFVKYFESDQRRLAARCGALLFVF